MNAAVTQMDKVVQAGAARAEEGAAVAEELSAQSVFLQKAVEDLGQVVGGGKTAVSHRASAPRANVAEPTFAAA